MSSACLVVFQSLFGKDSVVSWTSSCLLFFITNLSSSLFKNLLLTKGRKHGIVPTSMLGIVFVCAEVLRPSQPNWVMSSAVSLPNHTFTGQA